MKLKEIGKAFLVSLALGTFGSLFAGFPGFIGGFFGALFGKLVIKPAWKKIKPKIEEIERKIEELEKESNERK